MAVQINVAANQAALVQSINAGIQAYNQKFASQNQINLGINARSFSQPLGRITGDVKDFEAALAASNARVIAFGASTAVLGGVLRSFKAIAQVTIDVEKNLTDINRVFGLSTQELQKFSAELFNVSKMTASSFKDASQAALEFSRQGVKAEEVIQRTTDALSLARLAGMNVSNAIEALTATVNGFKATGITTTQVLNKLVAVEQSYAVSAGDLAEALSRTGLAAQEAGVNIDELNALVTAAQEKTARGGAVIGNALKTIFTRLQRTETLDQLEDFNIKVRDMQGNILPAVTILKNFASAYKGLADSQRAQLSEQVAGVYQVNILKSIISDLDGAQSAYNGALRKGAEASNEAEMAVAKLNLSLDALLSQTSTVAQQFAANIGKVTFEPLAKYAVGKFKSLFETLNETLEGEGLGSTFANGLLKGIRNVLAGPGAVLAFFTLFKLIQKSFGQLTAAIPQIIGITTETQNRKNLEQAILKIMQSQSDAAKVLEGHMGNEAAQAKYLLEIARAQTAEYERQSILAKSLASQLSYQGATVVGETAGGGLRVTRSGGYVPPVKQEVMGAKALGANSSVKAVSGIGKIGGKNFIANNQEIQIPNFAGSGETAVIPKYGGGMSKAIQMISSGKSGSILSRGYVPNFAEEKKKADRTATRDEMRSILSNYNSVEEALQAYSSPSSPKTAYWKIGEQLVSASSAQLQNAFIKSNLQFGGYDKLFIDGGPESTADKTGKTFEKIALGILQPNTFSAQSNSFPFNLNIPGGPNSSVDFFNPVSKLFYEAKSGGFDAGPVRSKFLRVRSELVQNLDEQLRGWNNILLVNSHGKTKEELKNTGYIPNFAPFNIKRGVGFHGDQHVLALPSGSDMQYKYEKDKKLLNIKYVESKEKGEGWKLWARAVKMARRLKSNIASSVILAQERDLYKLDKDTADFHSIIRTAYPQLNYRERGEGKNTSLTLTRYLSQGGSLEKNISGKRILQKVVDASEYMYKGDSATLYDEIIDNTFEISNLLDTVNRGFLPNFAKYKIVRTKDKGQRRRERAIAANESGSSLSYSYVSSNRVRGPHLDFGMINSYKKGEGHEMFDRYSKMARRLGVKSYSSMLLPQEKLQNIIPKDEFDSLSEFHQRHKYILENMTIRDILKMAFPQLIYRQKGLTKNSDVTYTIERAGLIDEKLKGKDVFSSLVSAVKPYYDETNPIDMMHLRDELLRRDTRVDDIVDEFAQGYLPNFANYRIARNTPRGTGDKQDREIVSNNRSSLRYFYVPEDEKKGPHFKLDFIHSLKSGEGHEMFSRYSKMARRMGVKSYSSVILPQKSLRYITTRSEYENLREDEKKIYSVVEDLSLKDILKMAFPQLIYRERGISKNTSVKYKSSRKQPFTYFPLSGKNIFTKLLDELSMNYGDSNEEKQTFARDIYAGKIGVYDLVDEFAKGYLPNFANGYLDQVMGLESNLSGSKPILDTTTGPFPFIRNSTQPNFASAVADHGGINQALNDSYNNQVNSGLIKNGYLPNFAPSFRGITGSGINFQTTTGGIMPGVGSTLTDKARKDLLKAINNEIKAFREGTITRQELNNKTKALISSQNLTAQAEKDLYRRIENRAKAAEKLIVEERKQQEKEKAKTGRSSQFGTILAIAGPQIAGLLEQAAFGNKPRTDLTEKERMGQSLLSTGITALSTGASLGSFFGPLGTALGATAGALIGVADAATSASLSLEEIAQKSNERLQKLQEASQAGTGYVESLRNLQELIVSGASQDKIKIASDQVALSFTEIADVKLAAKLSAAGSDVEKLSEELQKYNIEVKKSQGLVNALANLKSSDNIFSRYLLGGQTAAQKGVKSPKIAAANLAQAFFGTKVEQDLFNSFSQKGQAFTDTVEKLVKEAFPDLAVSSEDFRNEVQRLADLLGGSSSLQIEDALKDLYKLGADNKLVQNVRKAATESFNTIMRRIEQNILMTALLTEKELGQRQSMLSIEKTLVEFRNSFAETMENFIQSSLPEGALKTAYGKQAASAKYFRQLNQLEVSRLEFQLNQEKDRRTFEQKQTEDFNKEFKSTVLKSPSLGQFYEKQIFPQIQAGQLPLNIDAINQKLSEELNKRIQEAANQKGFLRSTIQGLNLNNPKDRESALQQLMQFTTPTLPNAPQISIPTRPSVTNLNPTIAPGATAALPGITGQAVTPLSASDSEAAIALIEAIRDLAIQSSVFENAATKDAFAKRMEVFKQEKINNETALADAKKEFDIRQALEKRNAELILSTTSLQLEANQKILNNNLFLKRVIEQIGNGLKIANAKSEALILKFEALKEDFRIDYFKGLKEILDRRVGLDADILKQQRNIEDRTLLQDIQSKALQIAVERENTKVTKDLTDVMRQILLKQIEQDLGPEDIKRINENPYYGMSTNELNKVLTSEDVDRLRLTESSFLDNSPIPQQLEEAQKLNQDEQKLSRVNLYKAVKQSMPQNNVGISPVQAAMGNTAVGRAATNSFYNTSDFINNYQKMQKENAKLSIPEQIQGQRTFLADQLNQAQAAGNTELAVTIQNLMDELDTRKEILTITRKQIDENIKERNSRDYEMITYGGRLKKGFGEMKKQSQEMSLLIAEELPVKFADGMTNALMDVAKGVKSIGDAFTDMIINIGQSIMQESIRALMFRAIGSAGGSISSLFQQGGVVKAQTGGFIRGQNGFVVPGSGTGDKIPALLEPNEYVVNSRAAQIIGHDNLDALNFGMLPRFATGGGIAMQPELALKGDQYDFTGQLLRDTGAKKKISFEDYTAYAFAEDEYFKKVREQAIEDEAKRVQSDYEGKMKQAQLVSSIVGMLGGISLSAGLSGVSLSKSGGGKKGVVGKNTMSGRPLSLRTSAQTGGSVTYAGIKGYQIGGLVGYQSGGSIPYGSRISDNMTSTFNANTNILSNNATRRYAMSPSSVNMMQAGGPSASNTTNNSTNNNATNISINIDKSGRSVFGADTNSYEQQDIQFSKKMARELSQFMNVKFSDEQRYNGKLYKSPYT